MPNLLDSLIENIELQIAQGNTHLPIDEDVLAELYTDYDTAIQLPQLQTKEPAAVTQIPETAKNEPQPNKTVTAEAEESQVLRQAPVEVKETPQTYEPPKESPKPTAPAYVGTNQTPSPKPTAPVIDLSGLSLDELRHQGNTCSSCKLNIGEKRSQNTALNTSPRLMIITEPAGSSAEFIADPFAGDAGQLLTKMISAMNLDMKDVYLCMAHRCFGPGARETIGQTKPYLEKQIEILKPEVIVIFGGAAINILLGEQSLVKCRGKWLEIGNVPAIATYPPGYLLKKAAAKREAWNDLQQVMARLNL